MRVARRKLAQQPTPTELRVGQDRWANPIVGLPHTDEEGWWAQARVAFGTVSGPFVEAEIERLLNALRSCRTTLPLETAVNAALALIAGQKPQNEAEAMLAIQMALVHVMAVEMLGRVGRLDVFANSELTTVAGTTATKLVRAFAGHVETLHKIRRPPVQTVRVERVNVEAGGRPWWARSPGLGPRPERVINPMERTTREPESLRLAPRCCAKTRAGTPCMRPRAKGRSRCKLHGGAQGSGAPEGERHGRYVHGLYTAEAIEERRSIIRLLRSVLR
jgi:hypothetical protein